MPATLEQAFIEAERLLREEDVAVIIAKKGLLDCDARRCLSAINDYARSHGYDFIVKENDREYLIEVISKHH